MRFLLYDHSGCYNRGCEAIVRTTVSILRRSFPDCAIGLCSYNAAQDDVLRDIPNFTVFETTFHAPTGVKWFVNAFYYKALHTERYYFKTVLADTGKPLHFVRWNIPADPHHRNPVKPCVR